MNGVDGVVLVVIQTTDDPSAERTAPPRSTHVQPGDVSSALIQQGERERLGKTPSSSSTTAWWWWRSMAILQGFAKHRGRGGGREVGLRQGEVKTHVLEALKTSTIYRGEGGGAPPLGFPPQGVRLPPITSRKQGFRPGQFSPLVPVQSRTGTNGAICPGS